MVVHCPADAGTEGRRHPHSYDYKAWSETITSRIHTIVGVNLGKTVAELGEFEIDERKFWFGTALRVENTPDRLFC
jgi:hypothetical protein